MSEKQTPFQNPESDAHAEFDIARDQLTASAEKLAEAVGAWQEQGVQLVNGESVREGASESKIPGLAIDGAVITRGSNRMPGVFYREQDGSKVVEINSEEDEDGQGRDITVTIDPHVSPTGFDLANPHKAYISITESSYKGMDTYNESLYIRPDGSVKHEQSSSQPGSAVNTGPVLSGHELTDVAVYLDQLRENLVTNPS